MLTEEEIRIKLGLDSSELDSGTRRALQNITGFGKEAHSSFLHADSSARNFKKTVKELSEQVPLLGYALRVALSPIGASFAVAAAGIAYATSALEKFNQKLDETGKRNAQSITGPVDKWASFFRVRNTLGSGSGKGGGESRGGSGESVDPAKVEANEKLITAKGHADDLIKAREQDLAEREKDYTPDGYTPWWKRGLRRLRGLKPGQQPSFDPLGLLTDDAAKSDSDYKGILKAKSDLQKAKDQASLIGGTQAELSKNLGPDARQSSTGLWGMLMGGLGLGQTIGITNRAAAELSEWKNQSRIDPNTGGIAYRPLQAIDSDTGMLTNGPLGIKYKPIRGAPGYVPPVGNGVAQSSDPMQRIISGLMGALQNGFPVVGKDQ